MEEETQSKVQELEKFKDLNYTKSKYIGEWLPIFNTPLFKSEWPKRIQQLIDKENGRKQ